jgi:elongator complex protein 3
MNDYDSFKQVINRLSHYKAMGHLSEKNKIEVIILGGTFLGMPKDYKENFVKGIFDALNGVKAKDLEEAKKMNEKASNRCVQFIVETRPDFCFEKHVDEMLSYGVTGVEIGVQTISRNLEVD